MYATIDPGQWTHEGRLQRIGKTTLYLPLHVLNSTFSVGRPKYQVVIPNTTNQLETYIGEELTSNKRGLYKLKHPLSHGVIEHWDDMELLWKHAFSLLKIAPNECPVLLTEANMNPTKHKRKMLEIFFEKFQVPAVYVAVQGVLSL